MKISAAKPRLLWFVLLGGIFSTIPTVYADDAIVLDPAYKRLRQSHRGNRQCQQYRFGHAQQPHDTLG